MGFVLRGLGIGFWTLSFGFQVKVSVYYAIAQNPKSLDFGLWAWDLRLWVIDFALLGLWIGDV